MTTTATSSQTVGPFYHIGLAHLGGDQLTPASDRTTTIHGRVIDGDGAIVPDFILEIWQPRHPGDTSAAFARVLPGDDGAFTFRATGSSPLNVCIFMRGLLKPLLTRMYFPNAAASDSDPALTLVPAERRTSLIARQTGDGLQWNVVLQGDDETVFFEW